MRIEGEHTQSIWYDPERDTVKIVDQTRLPHDLMLLELASLQDACRAISSMQVRGAPLIGVTAAYGVYLGLREEAAELEVIVDQLAATRPTAVNLSWALNRCQQTLQEYSGDERVLKALELAQILEKEDVAVCEGIGEQGASLLQALWERKKEGQDRLNVLTHCNAGSLATVDWGTALAVIYKAAERGIPVHVWVDETRPRNQGAAITCWELAQQGIPHTLIVDNAGGHLMQHGEVDAVLVGADRTTARGDVCNKIGTYLKALAARDNDIPFYVAFPLSSFDLSLQDGLKEIPIEERDAGEVLQVTGLTDAGARATVSVAPVNTRASNYGFDVTPARLVSALITEVGVCEARPEAIAALVGKR
jgi:methylthioribose-1-phosphate isomerase